MTAPLIISFDPGYGNSKAAYINGTQRVAVLPSVVGVGSTDLGLLDEMAAPVTLGRRKRAHVPDQVAFDGISYLVGEHVAAYARPIERMDFLRLADGPELRALFYAAMHRLLGAGTHTGIALMVGLPVEVMTQREQALTTRRELRAWLLGPHAYTVGGQAVQLEVTRVEVLAQPAGSYFAWGLDNAGAWQRTPEALKGQVAVCDTGFNTLDLFVLQGGNLVARYTAGETVGMRRAAELIIQAVRQQHGIALSLHEADALMRESKPTLAVAGGTAPLGPLVRQARELVAAAVVSFTDRQWGNGRQFSHVLFTGGGAEALRATLSRHYPHGVVLPEAVSANAVGLAKYGLRAMR